MQSKVKRLMYGTLLVLALLSLCCCASPQGATSTSSVQGSGSGEEAAKTSTLPTLPAGVVPVTWEVSPEHLMIQTDEARALYNRIDAEDYPTMDELMAHPVVAQLDALSDYYKAYCGNTADIKTPERDQLRKEAVNNFLSLGSARTESIDNSVEPFQIFACKIKEILLHSFRSHSLIFTPDDGGNVHTTIDCFLDDQLAGFSVCCYNCDFHDKILLAMSLHIL